MDLIILIPNIRYLFSNLLRNRMISETARARACAPSTSPSGLRLFVCAILSSRFKNQSKESTILWHLIRLIHQCLIVSMVSCHVTMFLWA